MEKDAGKYVVRLVRRRASSQGGQETIRRSRVLTRGEGRDARHSPRCCHLRMVRTMKELSCTVRFVDSRTNPRAPEKRETNSDLRSSVIVVSRPDHWQGCGKVRLAERGAGSYNCTSLMHPRSCTKTVRITSLLLSYSEKWSLKETV